MKLRDIHAFEHACDYIVEHLGENILISDICKRFEISRDKLQRICKQQFGKTFINYVLELRLYKGAEKLIGSDDSIEKVAKSLSYTKSYFITRFQRQFECTPDEYRRMMRVAVKVEKPYFAPPTERSMTLD